MAKKKPSESPDKEGHGSISDRADQRQIVKELRDPETSVVRANEAEIVKKYDQGQARIVIQRNDFLVPNILQMVERREILDISPDYQRRTRWNDTKKSHLIESLLMNVPIPPIFLYEVDLARYEVMDGQQRLSAIRAFFRNQFKLRDLKKWPELNDRTFSELPDRIKAGLERRGLAAVIILTESSQANPAAAMEIRQYVFERLNTGGVQLNAQEVRNCIYAGKFNDMLVRVARSQRFTRAWDIPPKEPDEPHQVSRTLAANQLYAKMADCEIVLRYFALSDMSKFRNGMKRTLDLCMADKARVKEKDCKLLESEYLEVLDIASKIYGVSLFRLLKNGTLSGRRSVPLADAVLLAIASQRQYRKRLIANKDKIVDGTKKLLSKESTYEALVAKGNTKADVENRISIMSNLIRRYAN